ncbi:MAG: pyridoxamine 5'-phosphate oxidase family protein [Sporichthyaceae bacterium]
MTTTGFHPGELLVQQRAGVAEDAARLVGMLGPARLDGRPAAFLGQRILAMLTARDPDGRLWTTPVLGPAGFLRAYASTLDVHASRQGPLAKIGVGSPAGLIAVHFPTRNRFRVNGVVAESEPFGIRVEVAEAYGNCPSYIQGRSLAIEADTGEPEGPSGSLYALDEAARRLVENADTFFLGTVHPERGADTSHKGGQPGFVRVDSDGSLWWPDYEGNNMFNSFGNIVENPEAALLFFDFEDRRALHLSGTAAVEWTEPGVAGDDDGTGRRVRFRVERAVWAPLPLKADDLDPSPANPALTG